MLLALPLSQPAPWAPFGEVSTARMSLIENSGRWLGTTSVDEWDHVFDVNVRAHFLTCRAALPLLSNQIRIRPTLKTQRY